MPNPDYKKIYEYICAGKFIYDHSTSREMKALYQSIDENFDTVEKEFAQFGYHLEKGDGYYHFPNEDTKSSSIAAKVEYLAKWIDIVDLLLHFNPSIDTGQSITVSELNRAINTDSGLQNKALAIARGRYDKDLSNAQICNKLVEDIKSEGYIEVVNTQTQEYRFTPAWRYIIKMIKHIKLNNPDTQSNEMLS